MPDGFQEEWQIRKKYMARLEELLFKKVDQGLLSRQQAINEILAVSAEVLAASTTGFPWAKTGRFKSTQQELGERGFMPFLKEIARYQSPAEWTAFLTVETRKAEKYQAGLARERQEIRGIETARKQREAKGKMQAGMAMLRGQDVWGGQRAIREHYQRLAETQEARARAGEFMQRPTQAPNWRQFEQLQRMYGEAIPQGAESWIQNWFAQQMAPTFYEPSEEVVREERAEITWPGRPEVGPEIPSWMRPLAPGVQIKGKGISGRLPTPSGQQWGRLLPSQKAQYFGLAQWAGKEPADIMAKMGQMAPRTPYGRPRWRPIRQRISR